MSQPQVQSRPSVVNGASRRRGDRDIGTRPESVKNDHQNHRPFRPSPSLCAGTESLGLVNQTNNIHFIQAHGPIPSRANKIEACEAGESRDGGQEPLSQHLLYLTACLIGQLVEVQVKNGSIYSGVFHTASAEKDYGIVLRVARLIRNGSLWEKHGVANDFTRLPVKTLLIQAKDLVQINAKDVPISAELLQNGRARENRAELVTDSFLTQGRQGEIERELKPWTPDNEDLRDLGLDSTFHNTWNRNWDQFEINKTLFGVESTFNEELYTTKLDRGLQSREREREACRIAREIEAQNTKNFHVAETQVELDDGDGLDEESRFASVVRLPDHASISEKPNFVVCNNGTSGSSCQAAMGSDYELCPENSSEVESRDSNKPEVQKANEVSLSSGRGLKILSSETPPTSNEERMQGTAGGDSSKHVTSEVGGLASPVARMLVGDAISIHTLNLDPGCPQVTEDVYRQSNELRQPENAKRGKKLCEEQVNELKSFSESLKDFSVKQHATMLAGSSYKTTTIHSSSHSALSSAMSSCSSTVLGQVAGDLPAGSRSISSVSSEGSIRVSSSEMEPLSDSSQVGAPPTQLSSAQAASAPLISPTTIASSPSSSSGRSTGADAFRRSTLNPSAKEFKLNPNAKSFTPSLTPLRSPSPAVQAPVYVPGVVPAVAQMPSMTLGLGASSVGHSSINYTPYNPVATGSNPYVPSPGLYTPGPGVSGAAVSPVLAGGQSTIKVSPQLQQPPVAAQTTYGLQQPMRYVSQAPAVQQTSTYLHPNGHVYSQQMVFGQPTQVVYIQPYPQAAPLPPPQASQTQLQQSQPKHRASGTTVQGVQLCVAPPFIAGQQHFLPQVQVPQLSNPMQPTPAVLVPTTVSGIQPCQNVIGGMVTPTQTNSGTSVVRVGGKYIGVNFQQQ